MSQIPPAQNRIFIKNADVIVTVDDERRELQNASIFIENGKITAPIKGATLIGNGPEAMQQVSMVGNDLALDGGIGVCGKQGQSVPVGVGQPTLTLDAMTVGGTQ